MEIYKRFRFEAAHRLPNVPPDHKCYRLHGHSFEIELAVAGPVGAKSGWVIDFAEIGRAFEPIHNALDHRCLNDVEGLENPTSENLCRWLWRRIYPNLPLLRAVTVRETCTAGCTYRGEEEAAYASARGTADADADADAEPDSAEVAIAIYRVRAEGDASDAARERLLDLLREHVPTLRRRGLATARPVTLLSAGDGRSVLEIFEWRDAAAADAAHHDPEVKALWEALGEVAEFITLGDLGEATERFPHFAAIDGVID